MFRFPQLVDCMKSLRCRQKGRKGATTPNKKKFRTGFFHVTHSRFKQHQWMWWVKMCRIYQVANSARTAERLKRSRRQRELVPLISKKSMERKIRRRKQTSGRNKKAYSQTKCFRPTNSAEIIGSRIPSSAKGSTL